MKIRLAGICHNTLVNGPGIRTVLFAQGCKHHCPGCFNPETWDFNGGQEFNTSTVIIDLKNDVLLQGVTFSGGDPLEQAEAFGEIARAMKMINKDIWCYTGYTWEELIIKKEENISVSRLLDRIDILVDGQFNKDLADEGIKLRGSSNQRIIDVQASLFKGHIVMYDVSKEG